MNGPVCSPKVTDPRFMPGKYLQNIAPSAKESVQHTLEGNIEMYDVMLTILALHKTLSVPRYQWLAGTNHDEVISHDFELIDNVSLRTVSGLIDIFVSFTLPAFGRCKIMSASWLVTTSDMVGDVL